MRSLLGFIDARTGGRIVAIGEEFIELITIIICLMMDSSSCFEDNKSGGRVGGGRSDGG